MCLTTVLNFVEGIEAGAVKLNTFTQRCILYSQSFLAGVEPTRCALLSTAIRLD